MPLEFMHGKTIKNGLSYHFLWLMMTKNFTCISNLKYNIPTQK